MNCVLNVYTQSPGMQEGRQSKLLMEGILLKPNSKLCSLPPPFLPCTPHWHFFFFLNLLLPFPTSSGWLYGSMVLQGILPLSLSSGLASPHWCREQHCGGCLCYTVNARFQGDVPALKVCPRFSLLTPTLFGLGNRGHLVAEERYCRGLQIAA